MKIIYVQYDERKTNPKETKALFKYLKKQFPEHKIIFTSDSYDVQMAHEDIDNFLIKVDAFNMTVEEIETIIRIKKNTFKSK